MHIMILVLLSLSVNPGIIALVFLISYIYRRFFKKIEGVGSFYLLSLISILLSIFGTFIGVSIYPGSIPGMQNTPLIAGMIAGIITLIYLFFLGIVLKIGSLIFKKKS